MSRPEDSAVLPPGDLVELGRITGAYGIRGWVKIQPHAPAGSSALLKAGRWWLRRPVAPAKADPAAFWQVNVLKSRTQGSTIVGHLQGIEDRDQAEALRSCTVWVSRASFPAVEPDEYYWVDLIGCSLYGDQDGQSVLLGEVVEILDNGVHAVLRISRRQLDSDGQPVLDNEGNPQPLLDARGKQQESLVPFVAAHVHAVDLSGRRLDSNWPVEF